MHSNTTTQVAWDAMLDPVRVTVYFNEGIDVSPSDEDAESGDTQPKDASRGCTAHAPPVVVELNREQTY